MADYSTFVLLDPEFFASLDQRTPGTEYHARVASLLPDDWEIAAQGVWTSVRPPRWEHLRQGWKLHVSATPANSADVLERVAAVLARDPAAFKFASDAVMLNILLSKNWPREGGGKFITIYPSGDEQFGRLGRALAQATAELDGPYILSDRRVPGSRIVFYRFGEHLGGEEVDPAGTRSHRIATPGGGTVVDERRGYYQIPDGVDDPFGARAVRVLPSGAEPENRVTLNGRYQVRGALKYSNVGGMYHAWDVERDRAVVLRERRPLTGWIDAGTDAVALLRKEAEILRQLQGSGLAPELVDLFQVWEHHYLVMEHVEGTPLRDYAVARYFGRGRMGSPRRLFQVFRQLIRELAGGLEEFHRRGIVLRDLSVGNVLVRPDRSVCFIDFEYAWERREAGVFAPRVETPGFASPAQAAGEPPCEADDFYSLGAVVLELCSMLAPGVGLNRAGVLDAARLAMDEIGLPPELLDVARGLLEPDAAARWNAGDVRRALDGVRASAVPWACREPGRLRPPPPVRAGTEAEAAVAAEGVCRFLEASADTSNADGLWPASPDTYRTNPLSIRFGACGPIEQVRRARSKVPDAWLDWVEQRATPERCPPGLFAGLAGVALTLAACGRAEAARRVLGQALAAPLPAGHHALYDGTAGLGIAALALGNELDDAELRAHAERIGGEMETRAERRRHGVAWRGADGRIPCGLANGGSGIGLFYTYLGAATGDVRWWDLASRALAFELSQVTPDAGYAFWPLLGGTRRRPYRSPHVYFGTAGVATAVVRLLACTGDPELRAWTGECARTLSFRWTNKLWQDMGLAGWGETLLDIHAVTGDPGYRADALRVAEGLLPFQVRTRFGTAFPGGALNRVSSEFGMGASGIGLFLHRLVHGGHRAFFPDHLLPGFPASAPLAGAPASAAVVPGPEAGSGRARPAAARRRVRVGIAAGA
ncbi:class III lanthionine synthetase LanKC [Longimicrobium sp.]|uniref:class III lanthionine synthetase LanKC n=1 Tax=Longimicrobium sp. TaxID=2029185 RepID=UPI002C589A1F|nr:class III lanthionine synthetase LanKC [Longimicrobium sp.]HSU15583.1 class III lanthionine synthetase LanKC [Longimicrobium sp.]